jgi:hypothetical protein
VNLLTAAAVGRYRHLVHQTPLSVPQLPSVEGSELVVAAPEPGEGHWAGGPSAVYAEGAFWLAYRLRRPVGAGRGFANVVARSDDGVRFEPVARLDSTDYGVDSLERPALVQRPDGGWRIYLSLATPGTLHWKVDALDADTPEGLPGGTRRTVWPGDARTAAKDPVVLASDDGWQAWVCIHPLPDADEADRMTTRYATSADGLGWDWQGDALLPRDGLWDSRGARLTAVVPRPTGGADLAFYDGRASAAENWYERTGIAVGTAPGRFQALGTEPFAQSPYGHGTFRYLSAVSLPDGSLRVYFEAAGESGGNDLRTQLLDAGALRALTAAAGAAAR